MVKINSDSSDIYYKKLQEKGISAEKLDELDSQDGNADGQIKASIFKDIENIVNEAKKNSNSNANVAQQTEADHWQRAVDILLDKAKLKANEIPNRHIAFGITDTVNNEPNDANSEDHEVTMQKFADELVLHYASGRDPKQFEFTGLPIGINAVSVTYKINADDSSNDTYYGTGEVVRKADSITAIVTYDYNGEEYIARATTTALDEKMRSETKETIPSVVEYYNKQSE